MLIWINGPFGVGKTTLAYELHQQFPHSTVYDPEEIGFSLGKTLSASLKTGDFQDIPLWREFNCKTLEYLLTHFSGPVIAPMTLVNPQYFDEIIGELRRKGFRVHHFTLMASKETVLRRLRGRGDGAKSWGAAQLERCLTSLEQPLFAQHLDTEGKSLDDLLDQIVQETGLTGRVEPPSPTQRRLNRFRLYLKHIR